MIWENSDSFIPGITENP